MYKIDCTIRGTKELIQHGFNQVQLDQIQKSSKRLKVDYSMEWLTTMYVTDRGFLYQPATHIESAMQKAAASFKIKGQRTKTWTMPIKAYVYVTPTQIIHLRDGQPVRAPDEKLLRQPLETMWVDVRRVVVQRASVARSRLMIASGWELNFQLEIHDDEITPDIIEPILVDAGFAMGIGDYRPRYGRFEIVRFELL
jgi:hypothetical protein